MDPHIEILIAEVYKRPVLWNKKNKSYHYHDIVDKNWQTVAKLVHMEKIQCKKKWKGIRDQFRVEFKKIPNATSPNIEITDELIEKYTVWPHFKSLLFLKDHMKLRAPVGGTSSMVMEYTAEYDSSMEDSLNDTLGAAVALEGDDDKTTNETKKRMPISTESADFPPPRIKRPKLEFRNKHFKTRNDNEAFFESLLPYFDTMDLKTKMLCRMEIQKVVYNYAFASANDGEYPNDNIEAASSINSLDSPQSQDVKPFQIQEYIM